MERASSPACAPPAAQSLFRQGLLTPPRRVVFDHDRLEDEVREPLAGPGAARAEVDEHVEEAHEERSTHGVGRYTSGRSGTTWPPTA